MTLQTIVRLNSKPALLLVVLVCFCDASAQGQVSGRPVNLTSVNNANAFKEMQSQEILFEKLKDATTPPVISAIAGSRDGQYLAVAGDDHAIRIIEAHSGRTIQTVIGHQDWIQSLLFVYPNLSEPNGSQVPELYSAGHDGRVLRWKYDFPLESEELAIVPYAIRSISVSSQKKMLAIGGFSDEVLLYDLSEGQYVHRLKCNSQDQRCVQFSPDGSRVLSGSRDGEILVWDATSGDQLAQYRQHQMRIHTAAFSADGNWITSAGEDRRVVRYSISEQAVLWNQELALSKMMALCLVNDQVLAVAGADNKIRLYDAPSSTVIAEMSGHQGTVAVMCPCGEQLASGSFDTTVRIWNLVELEEMRSTKSIPTSTTPIKMDTQLRIR
jgi:WD40 repeat protein